MLAAMSGHREKVQLLIAAGADVNARDNCGRTALMIAKEMGHIEIVQLLRANGAAE
jgi:ankyrin repeat protein